tara:strand:+ start:7161 stop:8678 length:1518 start_codon:yes stop_codon:yes gene_type:complete
MAMVRISMTPISVVGALLTFLGSTAAWAADLSIVPQVSSGVGYSDNITLTHDAESSSITRIDPSITLKRSTAFWDLGLTWSKTLVNYANQEMDDIRNHSLNFHNAFRFYDDRIAYSYRHRIYRQQSERGASFNQDTLEGFQNSERLSEAVHRLNINTQASRWLDISGSVAAKNTHTQTSRDTDSDQLDYGLKLSTPEENTLGLQGLLSWQVKDRTDHINTDNDQKEVVTTAQLGIKRQFWALGYEGYDESFDNAGVSNSQGETYHGPYGQWYFSANSYFKLGYRIADDQSNDDHLYSELRWAPTTRTQLTFKNYQRFFGEAFELKLRQRLKRTSHEFSATREVSQRFGFASSAEQDELSNQQNPNLQQSNGPIDNDAFDGEGFVAKTYSWRSDYQRKRHQLSIKVEKVEREYFSQRPSEVDHSFTLDWQLTLSRSSSLAMSYDYQSLSFGTNDEDDLHRISLNWHKQLNQSIDLSADYSYSERISDTESREYDANYILFSLKKAF